MNIFINFLNNEYQLNVENIKRATVGVGGDTFFVSSSNKKYVFKIADSNEINKPESEPEICEFLLSKGLPVSKFIRNKYGNLVSRFVDGRCCHLQEFIEGDTYKQNTAPDWFMNESAILLGKLHRSLLCYKQLPEGIGAGFFKFATIDKALVSYEKSLKIAIDNKDKSIIPDLEFRINLAKNFPKMCFDIEKLTVRNSHGDYTINQLICNDKRITGIIDWTCACRHPVIWELTRSFFYASPRCIGGKLDEKLFDEYVRAYCEESPLNNYDKENIFKLYYYQLAVCDYYSQYLSADDSKKEEFLTQAIFATKVLKENRSYI